MNSSKVTLAEDGRQENRGAANSHFQLNGATKRYVLSAELIEAVRALSPIDQVVGEHIQLRRSGTQFIGCCLFHADRTPSFVVHPSKQVFRCHGCGAGGDVFEFVRLLLKCGFRDAVCHLAEQAGIKIDAFKATPELTAKISILKAQREDELAFKRFCDERIEAVNQQYRSLGRAASDAETCLRAGESDPYIQELAWSTIEHFLDFQIRVEREGLCDADILRTEWQACRGDKHVTA
jgi:hypothetical protein